MMKFLKNLNNYFISIFRPDQIKANGLSDERLKYLIDKSSDRLSQDFIHHCYYGRSRYHGN